MKVRTIWSIQNLHNITSDQRLKHIYHTLKKGIHPIKGIVFYERSDVTVIF